MKSDDLKAVECIGSFARVSFWSLDDGLVLSSGATGTNGGTINGNDAVIVARELRKHDVDAKCRLLNPTDSDVRLCKSLLGSAAVVPFCEERGRLTESLCIQDSTHERTWIFSRVPEPTGYLTASADFLYIDHYPEFVQFLDRAEHQLQARCHTIVNMSRVTKAPYLFPSKLKPTILQGSVLTSVTLKDALSLARTLLETSGCEMVFLTMGERGAVLADMSGIWFRSGTFQRYMTLGAGALFSVAIVLGLQKNLAHCDLLEWSVMTTASKLQTFEMD